MKKYEHYIGVDVSKKTLDISVLRGKEKIFYLRISNDENGIRQLRSELKKHRIRANHSLFCLENTGSYGNKICGWAVKNSYAPL